MEGRGLMGVNGAEIEVLIRPSGFGPAIPFAWSLAKNGKEVLYAQGMPTFPSGYASTRKQASKRGNHAKLLLRGKI